MATTPFAGRLCDAKECLLEGINASFSLGQSFSPMPQMQSAIWEQIGGDWDDFIPFRRRFFWVKI
jgi:hypothetical protein